MLQIRLNTKPFKTGAFAKISKDAFPKYHTTTLVVYAEENGFQISRDERFDFIEKIDQFRASEEAAGKDVYFQIPYQVTVACSKEEWTLIKRYADINELNINDAAKKLITGSAGKDLFRHPVRDARLVKSHVLVKD
jgi:hypothetical protein